MISCTVFGSLDALFPQFSLILQEHAYDEYIKSGSNDYQRARQKQADIDAYMEMLVEKLAPPGTSYMRAIGFNPFDDSLPPSETVRLANIKKAEEEFATRVVSKRRRSESDAAV